MRQITLAVFVVVFAFNFSVYSQVNQIDLLKALLDVPAPPPTEKVDSKATNTKIDVPEDFYSKSKVPADNAPIEEILLYWAHHNERVSSTRYSVKPNEVVAQRIFLEIEGKPEILVNYINILPPKKDYIEFIKNFYDEKRVAFENASVDRDEAKPIDNVRDAIELAEKQDVGSREYENVISTYELRGVREWLKLNSKYYSDELEKKSKRIKDNAEREYISGDHEEFVALAKVDWEKAEPIIERMLADRDQQPASASLAMWAAYAHYMHEEDESGASKYRRMLQEVVEDKKAAAGVRDLALDALVLEGDFQGRDDWYISLLEDETLYTLGSYTGLKTIINNSPPEYWIPKMIPLVGHDSKTVHNAAVRNLIIMLGSTTPEYDKLIAKALMPWLVDKNWAREDSDDRSDLIKAYARLNMSEAIPAIIQVLQTEVPVDDDSDFKDKMKEGADAMKRGANIKLDLSKPPHAMPNETNSNVSTEGLSSTQDAAIEALRIFKDSRAVPALMAALDRVSDYYERISVIHAIIECGGYDANQQLEFVEKLARKVASDDSELTAEEIYYGYDNEISELGEQIGLALVNKDEPDDGLVRLAIARVKILRKEEPKVAQVFNTFLQKWQSKVLDIERLNSIGNNTADLETILLTLADRKDLVKKYPNQVASIRGSKGVGGGITACLFEDVSDILRLANGNDTNASIAALACARLLRVKLPVDVIGQMLNNSNPILALAAERYLISEDSFEARRLILSKYPNEAKILGARFAFVPDEKKSYSDLPVGKIFNSVDSERYYSQIILPELDKAQKKLQEEVKNNENLIGIYGFLENKKSGHKILRIFKDKAVYTWHEDDARYRERVVNKDELKLIFDYVVSKQIEELKPILSGCEHGCPSSEFVMFGRNGGRRIYIYNGNYFPQPLRGMKSIFEALEQGESKLNYWLQDKIAGLEVILDEKNVKAKSLWKNGEDFRVLVLDEKLLKEINKDINEQQENARKSLTLDGFDDSGEYYKRSSEINKLYTKQRLERKYEPYAWRKVAGDKLGEKVSTPAENYYVKDNDEFPDTSYLDTPTSIWNARNTNFELRTSDYGREGLWKVSRNGLTTQITKGDYEKPVITSPDGKWAIARKNTDIYYLKDTYRINLQTGKEHKISTPNTISLMPISYVPSHNKFLIYEEGFDLKTRYMPPYMVNQMKERLKSVTDLQIKPQYYLLDAKTGSMEKVVGEFTPLVQITFRNLQKTSNADEFWAAIPNEKSSETSIGRYNSKTFKFKEILKIPQIKLSSMDIWVDENDSKLYFIYEGQLLSLPFVNNNE